jgi:hypothetical protein
MDAGTYLAPHFKAGEFGAQFAPSIYLPNIRRVAQWLEVARGILSQNVSDPRIRVTSGWRSPERNVSVGGSPSSSHLVGEAADFQTLGQSQWSAWRKLSTARTNGTLPRFDQIIFYPVTGHIHVGLGSRMRNEFRVRLYEGQGGTPLLSNPDTLSGAPAPNADADSRNGSSPLFVVASIAAVALLALALFRKVG